MALYLYYLYIYLPTFMLHGSDYLSIGIVMIQGCTSHSDGTQPEAVSLDCAHVSILSFFVRTNVQSSEKGIRSLYELILFVVSEIKPLHSVGVSSNPRQNSVVLSQYLYQYFLFI